MTLISLAPYETLYCYQSSSISRSIYSLPSEIYTNDIFFYFITLLLLFNDRRCTFDTAAISMQEIRFISEVMKWCPSRWSDHGCWLYGTSATIMKIFLVNFIYLISFKEMWTVFHSKLSLWDEREREREIEVEVENIPIFLPEKLRCSALHHPSSTLTMISLFFFREFFFRRSAAHAANR